MILSEKACPSETDGYTAGVLLPANPVVDLEHAGVFQMVRRGSIQLLKALAYRLLSGRLDRDFTQSDPGYNVRTGDFIVADDTHEHRLSLSDRTRLLEATQRARHRLMNGGAR